MLTVLELRTALLSSNPGVSLEAIARRELNRGCTRQKLSDALADLMPELRQLPEYTDQWEDNLVTLVDRLSGWTHASVQLHSPIGTHTVNGKPAESPGVKLPPV